MSFSELIVRICVGVLLVATFGACGGGGGGSSNLDPVGDAGNDQVVTIFSAPIPIDGRASRDDDGDILSYQWELVSKPVGSSAFLIDATSATPSLSSVDFEGVYEVSLVVNDGLIDSVVDFAFITAIANARNIILLIGDGMGFEQVRAAGMYANGVAGSLSFESFPYQGSVGTLNANGEITDSGAAATAMATGVKVNNEVISINVPGDGSDLETILESAKALGASTVLVTTTTISHATPASFGAHELNRNNFPEIISDYLTGSQPNILFGGAQFVNPVTAEAAGYTVVEDFTGLSLLNTDLESRVWGQFGETNMPYEFDGIGGFPHLSESTEAALSILDNDPDGFFLMVEGGRIDHAGHLNDLPKIVFETVEFSNTAQIVMNWAAGREDTLVIVTADHETGGLQVITNNGQGNFPDVTWSTLGHTNKRIPVYAWGVNAHLLNNSAIENTDIFTVMNAALLGN